MTAVAEAPTKRPQLGRQFLITGGKMAAIPFIFGMSGLVYFISISNYDDAVGAAYGVALTVTQAVTMLGAGVFIYAMHRLPGDGLHAPGAREQLAKTGGAVVSGRPLRGSPRRGNRVDHGGRFWVPGGHLLDPHARGRGLPHARDLDRRLGAER